MNCKSWTEEEIQLLKDSGGTFFVEEIASELDEKNPEQVRVKANNLGINLDMKRGWSFSEENLLKQSSGGFFTAKEIACRLGRPVRQVEMKARILKVWLVGPDHVWTEDENRERDRINRYR